MYAAANHNIPLHEAGNIALKRQSKDERIDLQYCIYIYIMYHKIHTKVKQLLNYSGYII